MQKKIVTILSKMEAPFVAKAKYLINVGQNHFESDVWDQIKSSRLVKHLLQKQTLIEIPRYSEAVKVEEREIDLEKPTPLNPSAPEYVLDLTKLTDSEIKENIKGTYNLKVLKSWKEQNLSKKNRDLLDAQIKEIDPILSMYLI
jgi:hypothetical protein